MMEINRENSKIPRATLVFSRCRRAAAIFSVLVVWFSCGDLLAGQSRISRVVIIWLKRPGNAQDQAALIRASKEFRKIKGVIRVEAGKGMPAERKGIDQSFDVGVVLTFKDRAALERYQKDPGHLLAIRQVLLPLARRYIVYNSLLE
jgi:hypothetical protein